MSNQGRVWEYRGHRLRKREWGLWKDLDRESYYFLSYRPQARKGRQVRR